MIFCNIELPYRKKFTVKTDSGQIADALLHQYGMYVNVGSTLHYSLIQVTRSGSFYNICHDGSVFLHAKPLQAIHNIVWTAVQSAENIIPLHGAAVEYNGKAHVFLSSTGGGKTTLTAYLLNHNCRYITDDCILLDATNKTVHPCTTPLHLRKGGIQILNRTGNLFDMNSIQESSQLDRYVFVPSQMITYPVSIERIYFICRTASHNKIHKLSSSESAQSLCYSSLIAIHDIKTFIAQIMPFVRYPCYNLQYSELEFVLDVVRNTSV